MSHLTPEAKFKLSTTIRALRDRLLTDLHNGLDSTYRLSIPLEKAGLAEEQRAKRQWLEQWLDEQARAEGKSKKEKAQVRERHRLAAEKLAAATFLNRIVAIKQMEAHGLIKPALVTGGWQSPGYRELRDFATDLLKDETEGFGTLLQLLYDELALELPGLFGDVGIVGLIPIPASTLRAVIEALDHPELKDGWLDDTTLGWVYQYWNDPERKALDDKIADGGKIENHEIAAKTQIFTERYMVEWLLQNSLNQQWLAICEKNDWIPEVKSSGVLDALEERRKAWRHKREAGEVSPEAMMPIETEEEHRWKYWVPQPVSNEAVAAAPWSIRDLKMIDPAVGSGHFLIIAFALLVAFYEEEARHRSEHWTPKQIAEWIIENNLHGVDIDPRAVQIAAAALLLKVKSYCNNAEPKVMNLVASNLGLAALPKDDPAVVELKQAVREATGIPEELTEQIIEALKGADHLGSLLKVDAAVDEAIRKHEAVGISRIEQGNLFEGYSTRHSTSFDAVEARVSILKQLDKFLDRCTSGDDLGLRLRGEQLAAGVRFIRLVKEGQYDVVVANPPYQGVSNLVDGDYVEKAYPKSKADLYATFLERGLQLVCLNGLSAMITMRGWMFIKNYESLRKYLLNQKDLRVVGDLEVGAFEEISGEVVTAAMAVFKNSYPIDDISVALKVTQRGENSIRNNRVKRKQASLLIGYEHYKFYTSSFVSIESQPVIYWWDDTFLQRYAENPKLGDETDVKQGMATANNTRFLRYPWEVSLNEIFICLTNKDWKGVSSYKWVPYVKGAAGKVWFEPLSDILLWQPNALAVKTFDKSYPKNERYYFQAGASYSTIGSAFSTRIHRFRSVFDVSGSSVFPQDVLNAACLMNSRVCRDVLTALNPTVNFQVGDVKRLPLFPIESADEIFTKLDEAFTEHEAARETSVEFKQPGSSAWNYAQQWAQQAVDREAGAPLPKYQPIYEQPPATHFVSYTIGVALGRFGANGEGILNEAPNDALPNGILYLSTHSEQDSLEHYTCKPLKDTWQQYGGQIAKGTPLRTWLRLSFFKDVHLGMYENRPIYFPLSSAKKNFVALVSIHRWADNTLQTLLADYLMPELNQLQGALSDLMQTRNKGDRKSQAEAEKRYSEVQQLHDELKTFIDLVRQCAEQGPLPAKATDTRREVDARFQMDLDDGVTINSAALWCLLEPQWSQPKKWWSELCNAQGKKDYDWAHLGARYFPKRVDKKCQKDPSLAVAHGVFWKYHPAKAYEWELRLQDEIAPNFTIDEENSNALRKTFEKEHPDLLKKLIEAEEKRRERKRKKEDKDDYGPLFEEEVERASA